MRRAVAALTVILLGVSGVVHHSRAQTTTTAPSTPLPAQETRMLGAVPALEGRWLAVTTIGAQRGGTSLWEVIRNADGVALSERHVVLPDALRRNVAQPDWNPSAGDLDAITAAWETLSSEPRGIARIEHEVFGRDGFTDEIKNEPMTADALWVVRQTYAFTPARNRPVKEIRLLAAEREEPTGYRGAYLDVTIAVVPVPIPIKIAGRFRLIRLPAPPRSVWSRIAEVFRGCN
jgi:hypothetical protein